MFAIMLAACALVLPSQVAASATVAKHNVQYDAPTVMLTDSSGKSVSLAALLQQNRPVVLEFFYTTCTTICGLQTSALINARASLGDDCTLISISIDPEFDTATKLRAYAKIYHVKPNWHLLTGSLADIRSVLTAFDARPYGDNKMLHQPLVFIHAAPDRQWLRLEGLLDGKQIVAEYRETLRHPPPLAVPKNGVMARLFR